MAKKSFKNGINEILGILEEKEITKISNNEKIYEPRTNVVIKSIHLDKLKSVAYWERKTLKTIIDDALSMYIKNYEETNGEIKNPFWMLKRKNHNNFYVLWTTHVIYITKKQLVIPGIF